MVRRGSGQTTGRYAGGPFEDLMRRAPIAAFVKDADGRYVYANPHFLATMGRIMGPDWFGKTDADLWPPEAAAVMKANDEAALREGGARVFSYAMQSPDLRHNLLLIEFPLPGPAQSTGLGGVAIDITALSQAQSDRAQLSAAVDHAAESVMMVDLDGRITDVNAAFELATGYSRDEVLGQNPRFLKSGLQPAAFYEQMWAAIAAGRQWAGEMVDRRKDGSFFIQEAVISPVLDAAGQPTSYVAVNHDVTSKRALAENSARFESEHSRILDVVRDLLPDSTPEAKAEAICRNVAGLDGVAAAQILVFELDGRALPIGHSLAGRRGPLPPHLSFQVGRRLYTKALVGPWIEPWANRQGRAYNPLVESAGLSAFAHAPVRSGQRLIGLLSVESVDVANKGAIAGLLPTVIEFADLAGALMGREIVDRIESQRGSEHVSGIIAQHSFMPVFQPIVDMHENKVVGYEALTRFLDGSDPEAVFAEASTVHLGIALESASLSASLAAAKDLPRSAWLNVNASPEFVLAGGRLRSLLAGSGRPIVVELTEHEAVVDYPAVRAAMATCGPNVRFAVDDAGTGFTSLRHILELRPAFVKLDRWLVSGLEADEARQAMIVGLRHFARTTGCRLIAEGIETDEEIAILRSLDIRLGQGFALGRPKSADALAKERLALVAAGG